MNLRTFNYFIAKHFGIASDRKTYIIPQSIYVADTDYEDDKIVEYENIKGIQIFPINTNWLQQVDISFGEDSVYRSYIKDRIN